MTRKVLLRTMLAMLALPNFTAYWLLIPRGMKRFGSLHEVSTYRSRLADAEKFSKRWSRQFDRFRSFRGVAFVSTPVSDRDFRIPFSVSNNGWIQTPQPSR